MQTPMRTLLGLLLGGTGLAAAAAPENLEQSVCGAIKEPLMFALWSAAAGKADPRAAAAIPNALPLAYTTVDGRRLRGYKLSAAGSGPPQGFVLVAQGNAMLADQLLEAFAAFAERRHDVYLYDYRGYGESEGRPRLKAITRDYRDIFAALAGLGYERKLLYGISFGGIVVANVVGSGLPYDRAVIDSAPSRLSDHGCPRQYDPVENLPADSARLLVISGSNDRVVTPRDMRELLEAARARAARVVVADDFAHPFMDGPAAHARRMKLIGDFLFGERVR